MEKRIISIISIMVLSIFALNIAQATDLQALTVSLNGTLNPDHAPLIVAQQQGFFKEQGLVVKLIAPKNTNQLVAANKVDIGISYEPDFIRLVDHNMPFICIGTLIDKPLNSLVALKGNGIASLTDLKGKRIASSNKLSKTMLKIMLINAGLTEKDVQITNIKHNLARALLSHKVDAIADVKRNYETKNNRIVSFFPEDQGVPTYSELVFISHINNIKDQRFPRFLAAIKKAIYYLDRHPHQTWKSFAKQYPDYNNSINRDAWFRTMPYFSDDPASFHPEEWQKFATFMHKNQLIKEIQPASRYAVVLR